MRVVSAVAFGPRVNENPNGAARRPGRGGEFLHTDTSMQHTVTSATPREGCVVCMFGGWARSHRWWGDSATFSTRLADLPATFDRYIC